MQDSNQKLDTNKSIQRKTNLLYHLKNQFLASGFQLFRSISIHQCMSICRRHQQVSHSQLLSISCSQIQSTAPKTKKFQRHKFNWNNVWTHMLISLSFSTDSNASTVLLNPINLMHQKVRNFKNTSSVVVHAKVLHMN